MNDTFHTSLNGNIAFARKVLTESIYNTAKLEGVTATPQETKAIIDGVAVPHVSLDDIRVILNLRDAWRNVLSDIKKEKIDLAFIKKINESISRNESLAWGTLRTGAIGISGTNYRPEVPEEETVVKEILAILHESVSAAEKAINTALYIMYHQLFWDGNKRTANVVANAILIQHGAGILSISTDNITEFNRLLTQYYDTGIAHNLKSFLYQTAIIDFETKNVPVNVPVNPTEKAVFAVIQENPHATYDQIAQTIGKNRKTVLRAIAVLKQKGMITRQGSDKTGYWSI